MPQYNGINSECYAIITTFNDSETIYIPCYPDEISDTTSVNWSETGIIGRSSPIYSYNGTSSREISFSFDVHREMMGTDNSYLIDKMLEALRAAAYPNYENQGLIPPIVTFRFGNFKTKGILNSVGFTWKKPIVNRHYQYGTVSISMKETPKSIFSASDLYSPLNPFNA